MIEYFSNNLWQLWAIISILCLILELSSGDFFIMCFSIGAFVSLIAALCGMTFTAQIIVFAIASALCLWLIRPLALRYLHRNNDERPSNADALIGRVGRVSQNIEANGYGRVAIDGDDWKATGEGGVAIPKDTRVKVIALNSIIVTVEPVDETNSKEQQ